MQSADRRTFVRAVGATALPASLAGCSGSGDQDREYVDEEPDYGGYLDDVPNYDRTVDLAGRGAVTVDVGAGDGLYFDPPALQISAGTEVVWRWTGRGGEHNVVHEGGAFESDRTDETGHEFAFTFEEAGTYPYYCAPHETVGMKGAVVVV